MVAAPATTPSRVTNPSPAGDPLPSSPPSPALSPSASSASLLSDLVSPDLSFTDVAKKHNLTVEELSLLITTGELRAQIATTETAACQRLRLVSSLNLHAVVRTLTTVMDDFNALAKSHQASGGASHLTDPDYIRLSDRARRAGWMLYRLSRITPVDESALSRADAARPRARASTPTDSRSSEPLPTTPGATDPHLASAPPSDSSPVPSVALRDLRGESSSPSPSASSAALRVESSSSPVPSVALSALRGEPSSPSASASSAALRVESSSSPVSSVALRDLRGEPSTPSPSASSAALRVESSSSPMSAEQRAHPPDPTESPPETLRADSHAPQNRRMRAAAALALA